MLLFSDRNLLPCYQHYQNRHRHHHYQQIPKAYVVLLAVLVSGGTSTFSAMLVSVSNNSVINANKY